MGSPLGNEQIGVALLAVSALPFWKGQQVYEGVTRTSGGKNFEYFYTVDDSDNSHVLFSLQFDDQGNIRDPIFFSTDGTVIAAITPNPETLIGPLSGDLFLYPWLVSLLNNDFLISIRPGDGQTTLEVGAGGTATIAGGSDVAVWIWHDKNIDWTTTGTGNTLVFDAEQGDNIQTPGILFLNLATGTGTNPWGGTLSVQGVDQVSVGSIGGEYIVCNNAGDTINSGFGSLEFGGSALIVGGSGADTLHGSNADGNGPLTNVIVAGSGPATLTGGFDFSGGNEVTNIYSYNLGDDTITNFRAGANSGDAIDLSAVAGLTSFSDVQKFISQDGAGNTVINFGNGETITLDNVAASSLAGSNFIFAPEAAFAFTQPGEVDTGGIVKVYLAMTGVVTVNTANGSPTLTLSDGAVATYDAAASSAAGHVLVFDYTVGSNDHSPDLAIQGFSPSGAVIEDANGQSVNFSPIDSQKLGVQINPTPFYVTSVATSAASSTEVDSGSIVTITLNMSESSFTLDPSNLPFLLLSDGETASYEGSNGNQISFSYTVSPSDHSSDLAITAVDQGPLGGFYQATLTDNAGYVANLSNATNTSLDIQIGPTLYVETITTDASLNPGTGWPEANAGSTVHLTLNMNEGVTVSGAPKLVLNDGASATYDAALSTPGSGILVFDYAVGAKDNTSDLLVNSVSGGTIVNANDVAANFTNIDLLTTGLQINSSPLRVTDLSESATGQVSAGQTVILTLKFNEPFTLGYGGYTLKLNLNDGEQAFYDPNHSDPSTGVLAFDYLVGSEVSDPHTSNLEITGLAGVSLGSQPQYAEVIQDSNGNNGDISAVLNVPTGIEVGPPLYNSSTTTTWSSPEAVAGQTVQIDLNMSEGVKLNTPNGTPTLTFNNNAVATYDAAASNLATGQLVFDYQVAASGSTPFLYVQSVNLNGSTITDSSNDNADLTVSDLPALLTPAGSSAPLQIGAAFVTSVETSELGTVQSGQTLLIEINTTDFVTLDTTGGSPTLTLSNGATATLDTQVTNTAEYPSLVFEYTVGANDTSTSNLEITSVNLNGATITDPAGYNVNFSGALNEALNVQIGGGASVGSLDDVYQAVLQHGPSSAENAVAVSLEATVGIGGVIASVVDSLEAQNNVYPIVQIIELATGNMPTAAQLSGWVPFVESAGLLQGQSQTNVLLDQMAEAFVASTMFGNIYNGGTAVDPNAPITASIVAAIIQAATGIAATQAQIDAWVATDLSIDQVFVGFALGDQYTAYLQNTVQQYLTTVAETALGSGGLGAVSTIKPNDGLTATQVEGAYQAVLERAPLAGETNAALSIDASIGNVAAMAVIVDSSEAQYNVNPIVQIIELATGSLPTPAQLAGWVPFVESAGLLQGQSQTDPLLDQMAEAFVASTMFGNTYNGGTAVDPNAPITASIVAALIQAATGVAATQSQIDAWVGTGLSIDQVFVGFALGDQYTAASQNMVQDYLTATAINGAELSTVDGISATGALTLGTLATPLTGNELTVQGGSGSLTVAASGNGDTIDLGVVSIGTSITAAQTIHASGAGDTITFATQAADGTAVTWSGASTVDGGTSSTGIGANSTVNFGNNTGGGTETVVVTGDLTGATTSGGTSTSGIAMTTLGNAHDAAGDQIVFNNTTTEVLASTAAVNVTAAGSSLAKAFDLAAADAATSQGGNIGAKTGVIDWFQLGGNTYIVEAINTAGSAATHPALATTDEVIKITGLVTLSGETLAGHTLTL